MSTKILNTILEWLQRKENNKAKELRFLFFASSLFDILRKLLNAELQFSQLHSDTFILKATFDLQLCPSLAGLHLNTPSFYCK